jgi:hypothetical protein
MVEHESKRLVTTGEAARALGVSARTLQRYAHDGLVTPDVILPSPAGPSTVGTSSICGNRSDL